MAEANYHGKTCSAEWKIAAGAFAPLTNTIGWSITLTAGTAESTAMHATNLGKTREVGFKGGTATITCYLPGDVEIDEGDVGAIELLRGATNAEGGFASAVLGALCVGVDITTNKNGIEEVTYSFQLTGAVSATVTQGTS